MASDREIDVMARLDRHPRSARYVREAEAMGLIEASGRDVVLTLRGERALTAARRRPNPKQFYGGQLKFEDIPDPRQEAIGRWRRPPKSDRPRTPRGLGLALSDLASTAGALDLFQRHFRRSHPLAAYQIGMTPAEKRAGRILGAGEPGYERAPLEEPVFAGEVPQPVDRRDVWRLGGCWAFAVAFDRWLDGAGTIMVLSFPRSTAKGEGEPEHVFVRAGGLYYDQWGAATPARFKKRWTQIDRGDSARPGAAAKVRPLKAGDLRGKGWACPVGAVDELVRQMERRWGRPAEWGLKAKKGRSVKKRNPEDDLTAAIGDDPIFLRGEAPWPVEDNGQTYYISTGSKGAAFTLRTRFWEWGGGRYPQKYDRDRYVKNLGPNADKAVAKLRKMFEGQEGVVYWTPIELAARAKAGPTGEFRFGKYRGHTLDEVADLDPGYIVWLLATKDQDKSILQKKRYQAFRREVEAMADDPRLAEALEERREKDLAYQRKREQWAEEKRERERIKREAEEARKRGAAAGHVGQPGKRQQFDLEFVMRRCWDSYYGQKCVYKFRDADHREIVWFSSSGIWVPLPDGGGERPLEEGDRIRIKATVKEHGDYQGMPQTVIQRAKLVDVLELVPDRVDNPVSPATTIGAAAVGGAASAITTEATEELIQEIEANPGGPQMIRLGYNGGSGFFDFGSLDAVWVVLENGNAVAAVRTDYSDGEVPMSAGFHYWFDIYVNNPEWKMWERTLPRRYQWYQFDTPCDQASDCAATAKQIQAIKRRVLR